MADWNALNDRNLRRAALDKVVRRDRSPETAAALEQADLVAEAAQYLRQMREHAKLTQEALGDRLGVTQARISELERGNSPEGMSYALLRRAAKACGFEQWPPAPMDATAAADDMVPWDPTEIFPMWGKFGGTRSRGGPRAFGHFNIEPFAVEVAYAGASAQCTVMVVPNDQTFNVELGTRLIRDVLEASPVIELVKIK